jgi:hypothetical protein
MTIAHISHYDLTEIGRTSDNIVFSGSLGACKRMAAAHGMEVESMEGAITGCDGNRATYLPPDESKPALAWFKGGGLIIRGRDDYSLLMPLAVWMND